ncbi:hypothetical protein Slin15195_G129360 [Septoria linicola]|uniref:Uncharacterized protein n=1 Tax=Septoria linicola TaxID=215465 RepID=A0A9Q9B0S9_9PEZI|nr:hypothetical protein Slin14017_G121900 [Septoria linicola]USW59617.1 hypothetical protein Slin15195_G129360 [Septoria linicola]
MAAPEYGRSEFTTGVNNFVSSIKRQASHEARLELAKRLLRDVGAWSQQSWQIFCAWKFLEGNDAIAAAGLVRGWGLMDQLKACVASCESRARKERAAKATMRESWPSWSGHFLDLTPQHFSIDLLQKLARLSRETPGEERAILRKVMEVARDRLQKTRSQREEVVVRDVNHVLELVKEASPPPPSPEDQESQHGRGGQQRDLQDLGPRTSSPLFQLDPPDDSEDDLARDRVLSPQVTGGASPRRGDTVSPPPAKRHRGRSRQDLPLSAEEEKVFLRLMKRKLEHEYRPRQVLGDERMADWIPVAEAMIAEEEGEKEE